MSKHTNIIEKNNSNQYVNKNIVNPIISQNNNEFLNDILFNTDKLKIEKNVKEKITRINVDSKNRNKIPKNILENNLFYELNPLNFEINSPIMTIKSKSKHNFKIEEKIILQNVTSKFIKLRGGLILNNQNQFIKIMHKNHGYTTDEFKYNDIKIKIEGVKGNTKNYSYIYNIPIIILNKIHKIYLTSDNDLSGNPDYYYIKITITPNFFDSSGNPVESYTDEKSNIVITEQNISGIPLNLINANYPININQTNGCHSIYNIIDDNTFQIELESSASKTMNGGGKCYFSKIKDFEEGYNKPSFYKINLKKSLHNVIKIKLISTEFPNTETVVKSLPESKKNNKLYWQNVEDGDKIYEINISPGNYTIQNLVTEIQNRINSTKRIIFTDTLIIDEEGNSKLEISEFNKCILNINSNTNFVDFNFYSLIIIEKPISIYNEQTYEDGYIRLKINHFNHGLEVNDTIVIENSVSTGIVNSIYLNESHTIESILDSNNYIIRLPPINLTNTIDTGGGSAVNILVPLKTRMFFNYPDTLGKILGFRHVGKENAITKFNFSIKNSIAYDNDFFQDSVGLDEEYDQETGEVKPNILEMLGDSYILMTCNIFKDNESLSSTLLNNIFAKIQLSANPGSVLFNTYIQLSENLKNPIPTLSSLEFGFYSSDGELYNFNDIDHSFTIEVFEEENILKNDIE